MVDPHDYSNIMRLINPHMITSLFWSFILIPMFFGGGLQVVKCSCAFLMLPLKEHCVVVTARPWR